MQLSYVLTGFAFKYLGIPLIGVIIGVMSLLCGVSWLVQFGRSSRTLSGLNASLK